MKLIDYAHKMGISYKTVWRWHKAGKIQDKLVVCEHVWATPRQTETMVQQFQQTKDEEEPCSL